MRATIAGFVLTLIPIGSALAAPPAAGPYDFKGVPLGISMAEFRATAQPDGRPATIICTGEKPPGRFGSELINTMVFDTAEIAAGVKKCAWLETSGVMSGSSSWLNLAGTSYATYDYSFSFVPDPMDGTLRLFKFSGTSNANAFGDVVAAITRKYGQPVSTHGTVQNRIGNSFTQTASTWTKGPSSITVVSPFTKVDDLEILMLDSRLNAVVKKAASDATAKIKNPI